MEVIYCGVPATKEYPGREISTYEKALSELRAYSGDLIIWAWMLGSIPPECVTENTGLILVSNEESIPLYRAAMELGCRHVLTTLESGSLTAAIEAERIFLQEQRHSASCRSLFQQYGDHLKIHLWYDLIVDGKYKDLLEPDSYRLLLFHPESTRENLQPMAQNADSPTIISGFFPEAIVILALQRSWECVVLPGDTRRVSERASQCQNTLGQKLGVQRNFWLSPPLLPSEMHSSY